MGKPVTVVWDRSFLGYDLGGDHPLNPVRLDLTVRLATELGVLDGVDLVTPGHATDDEIELVHRPGYLNAVKAAPTAGWDVGHGLGTADNPVFHQMHEASSLVVGGSLAAARALASGESDRAVNIAGGLHHAMPDSAAGFCVYNDCSIAIAWLLRNGFDRIAYIDVDVHHGDGVQTAFWDDPRVLTISLHQHPMSLWPGTGWPRETGGDDAGGTAVNIPLPPGTGDNGWLRAFHATVPALLEAFGPQLIVTQCGADTHREDPLADLHLSVDGHRAIYRILRAEVTRLNAKWLALGGGGYELLRVVPRSWTHLLATVLDRDVDPNVPLPAGWVSHATRIAPNWPLPASMTDECDPVHQPWGGDGDDPVDKPIRDTRRAVFPLHGLDPDDPRD